MAYDLSYPTINMAAFKLNKWKQFYGDVTEAIHSKAPKPRGKDVDLRITSRVTMLERSRLDDQAPAFIL
jgi:hypothetical protein